MENNFHILRLGLFSLSYENRNNRKRVVVYRPDGYSIIHVNLLNKGYSYKDRKNAGLFKWAKKDIDNETLDNAAVHTYVWSPQKRLAISFNIKKFYIR